MQALGMSSSPLRVSWLPAVVVVMACSTSSSSGGDAASFAQHFCVDPTSLAQGTPTLSLMPDAGAAVNRQHVKVGSCEAYLLYWANADASSYSDELVTNCAPTSLGGSSASRGFPADCLFETSGAAGIDKVAITMNCVCCAGGECGRYCHPVSLGDSGGGLTCASYSYDFQSSAIQDPRTEPAMCDCSGW
jgi:hypothetical protein